MKTPAPNSRLNLMSKIKEYNFTSFNKTQMLEMSRRFKMQAKADSVDICADEFIAQVFALVFEAIKRALNIISYDVQLQAAISMVNENIIELPTGEGKTIVAVFVAYYNSLFKGDVHVLTFNDFLAKRDALWMKPVYDLLGVSVDYICESKTGEERKTAYESDITYVTVKEAGYDYLRSFLAYNAEQIVQKNLGVAIVDEADSIMIDNARVPLIVAGNASCDVHMDLGLYKIVSSLMPNEHFAVDYYAQTISLTDCGYQYLENEFDINLYEQESLAELIQINLFLKAEFLLKRDVDYIVKNGKIFIVDEFTGRVMKDCRWPDGLQVAIEIKENVDVERSDTVLNRITIQNFLNLYSSLCGMTGTAFSSAAEFKEFYQKQVEVIPPNKPCARIDHSDIIFSNKNFKYKAIIKKVSEVHLSGRPILIGTASIRESEELSKMLIEIFPCIQILNAKNDQVEGAIIANAGKLNAITISTNMAGRGVDIRLGGIDGNEYNQVLSLGGLYIIGTNRHDSVRIDNQLRGRSGRQGDLGESVFYISLEDEIFVKHGMNEMIHKHLNSKQSDYPIDNKAVRKAIVHIQKVVEGQSLNAKLSLAKYSLVYEQQRQFVHKYRNDILFGLFSNDIHEYFDSRATTAVPEKELNSRLKTISLYSINECWSDHLLLVEQGLDEISVLGSSSADPFAVYNKKLIEAFEPFKLKVKNKTLEICENALIENGHINLRKMGIEGPASTKTYMLLDGTEELNLINEIAAASDPLSAPLYLFYLIFSFFLKRIKRK